LVLVTYDKAGRPNLMNAAWGGKGKGRTPEDIHFLGVEIVNESGML
jgi:hypothetical protein